MTLSKRAKSVGSSPTLAITAKANKMKQSGINVIGFGAGEPDFDTPDFIKNEAKKSIDAGFTKYTPTSGIAELKEAICRKFKTDNNLEYTPSQIIVSCGAKHSLYNAIQALCDEGDEVILPVPYWVSYEEQIKLAGGRPVFVNAAEENDFKITARQLKSAITPRTKLFILNSPSNPTGAVYSPEELEEIAKVIESAGIYCISDEIYENLVYGDARHVSIASFSEKIKKLTVVVNGLSKSYAMTGWRIGYAAAEKEIVDAMSNIQDHMTSNPVSFCQKAGVAALASSGEAMKKMVAKFAERRDYIVEKLNSVNGVSCRMPRGAFYAFPNVSKIIGKKINDKIIMNSAVLAEILLDEAKIAVIPGSAFGAEGYLRFSYATSMENIVEGMARFKKFVENIE